MLKVAKVFRSKEGQFQGEGIPGKFAVVIDEESEKSTVFRINCLNIEEIFWSREKGVFQTQISLGAEDSDGNYHADPKRKHALVSWTRDQHPQLWLQYGLEYLNGINFEEVLGWLHNEDSVTRAGRDIWLLENLESQMVDNETGNIIGDYRRNKIPPDPMVKTEPAQRLAPSAKP